MTHKEYLELLIGPLANEGGGGGIVPTGSVSITENGTVDVTQFAEAAVNVQPDLQAKSVTITENGTTSVAPDTGKDGLSGVAITVNVPTSGGPTMEDVLNQTLTGNISSNGVTKIPNHGLANQANLTGVHFPNCLSVGAYGLAFNTALKDVVLEKCTSFENPAWDSINNQVLSIERLILPKLVTMNWNYGTFPKLAELYAPLLESIGDSNIQAKSGTTTRNGAMKTLELPSIKTMGSNSFAYFQLLLAVKIGPNITSFGNNCFRNTNGVHAVIFDKDTAAVPSVSSMSSSFNGSNTKFYVPDALLTAWKAATNWNDRENVIFALSTIPAWTAGTYSRFDVVTNGGAYWLSMADSNTEEPTTGATNWLRVGAV